MDEPIRSHLPNENYRRGWDETFGDEDARCNLHENCAEADEVVMEFAGHKALHCRDKNCSSMVCLKANGR